MMIGMASRINDWLENNAFRRLLFFSFLFAFLLCTRFPRYLLHAELWGDDGWTFYPQAYNSGLQCLLWPVNGYLNTFQRLGALFAVYTRVPLLWLPTVFAVIGLSVQFAVCVFLVSSRLGPLWKSWRARAAFAALYIYLPNSLETFGTLTNSQWHLALLAFLVVVSPPAVTAGWRLFDGVVLVLSSLSGPFSLIMVPFCLAAFWKYRNMPGVTAELLTRSILLCAGALVQASLLLHGHSVRSGPLGASPLLLVRIISFQFFLGLLFGLHAIVRIGRMSWWQAPWPAATIALAASLVCIVAFKRGAYLFRAFSIFAALLFAAELLSPVGTDGWAGLSHPVSGQRYFLVPMLALLGAFFVLAAQKARLERWTGLTAIAIVLCIGVPLDSFLTHMPPTDYEAKARAFDAAPPGTQANLPLHPYGAPDMVLVKKGH